MDAGSDRDQAGPDLTGLDELFADSEAPNRSEWVKTAEFPSGELWESLIGSPLKDSGLRHLISFLRGKTK